MSLNMQQFFCDLNAKKFQCIVRDLMTKENAVVYRWKECSRSFAFEGATENCQNKTNMRNSRIGFARAMSTVQTQMPGSLPEQLIDPYRLLDEDMKTIYDEIRGQLISNTIDKELQHISTYYFNNQGKAFRPMLNIIMGRAINHHKGINILLNSQRQIAIISEMIHNASLLHDDVIDLSDLRRGKPSVNIVWNQKKVAMAGNYILSIACVLLARLQDNDVTVTVSQCVSDLVQGELMQLGSKETENERFAHYLSKNYRKTGSLMANCIKATVMLSEIDDSMVELCYEYGRNIGLAFQLMDDLKDFVSSSSIRGKPTAADLKLGLATAPVLFACEQFPELNAMIMRRFQEPGDSERAFELVHKSNGLEQTTFLAKKYCAEAIKLAQSIAKSPYQNALLVIPDMILSRAK